MHCPRCGSPNESNDRFCSACGASLQEASTPKRRRSLRERALGLVGTTRKARLISIATAGAIVLAIVALIALKPSEETIPRDAYTRAAERFCLDAKHQIVAAERSGNPTTFAAALVPVVALWRSRLQELSVPGDRIEQAEGLETSLREVEIRLAQLARTATTSNRAAILASAERAEAATAQVEEAVAALGLERCAEATIGFSTNGS